jgi:glycosyltransferase involved in cell wall biosynthesis
LSKNHEIILGCWGWDLNAYPLNDKHQWIYEDKKIGKEFVAFPIRKNPKEQIKTVYEILSRINCDVILTIGDYWNFAGFEQLKSQLGYSFKWISYLTIESGPIDKDYKSNFKAMDSIIVPSEFGQRTISYFGEKSTYIPFGIDDTIYKLDKKTIARERRKRKIKDDKIRFISVCKNMYRKNIPAFMQALKIANGNDSRVIGHLHTNVDKVRQDMYDINYLIKRWELDGILTVPSKRLSSNIAISEEELNVEYNCSDAFVMTSVAEGFGLPILESQRCGLVPIVPDWQVMSEHICNGELVESSLFFAPNEQEVGIVDPWELAKKMLDVVEKYDKYDKGGNIQYAKSFTNDKMTDGIEAILNSEGGVRFPFDEI